MPGNMARVTMLVEVLCVLTIEGLGHDSWITFAGIFSSFIYWSCIVGT